MVSPPLSPLTDGQCVDVWVGKRILLTTEVGVQL